MLVRAFRAGRTAHRGSALASVLAVALAITASPAVAAESGIEGLRALPVQADRPAERGAREAPGRETPGAEARGRPPAAGRDAPPADGGREEEPEADGPGCPYQPRKLELLV